MSMKSLATLTALLSLPGLVPGQIISVKTIPLITTVQFSLAPSYNAGMGGVSIAIDDSLADGFLNPARLAVLNRNMIYTAPYQDSWEDPSSTDPWNRRFPNQPGNQVLGSQAQAIPVGVIRRLHMASGRLNITMALALAVEKLRHASHRRMFRNPDTRQK